MKINQMFITFEIQKMYKMIILLCINGSLINYPDSFMQIKFLVFLLIMSNEHVRVLLGLYFNPIACDLVPFS